MDEHELIRQVEAADPDQLAEILGGAEGEEARALEAYFGPDRYRRMRRLASRAGGGTETRGWVEDLLGGPPPKKGNVVFLPGIMGSELSASDDPDVGSTVWLTPWRIASGQLDRLKLARNGVDEADSTRQVRPTGVLKKYYGEIALSLARNWNVKLFPYDWRKNLNLAAKSLDEKIGEWFPDGPPVHLVAHSMGGLVARTFIQKYPGRWRTMGIAGQAVPSGGRLIMLGTPNYGSFLVPQMVTGLASTIRKLALLDLLHDLGQVQGILNTFAGAWQMLPSPSIVPEAEPLYAAATYDGLSINQDFLDAAEAHHALLAEIIEPGRMIYVAGYNQPTHAGIKDYGRIGVDEAYEMTFQGDGSVPHSLGLLEGVTTYFVESEHSALPSNAKVLGALDALLLGDQPRALAGGQLVKRGINDAPPATRGTPVDARAEMERRREREMAEFEILTDRMLARSARAGGSGRPDSGSGSPPLVAPAMTETGRRVEAELVRGWLDPGPPGDSRAEVEAEGEGPEVSPVSIEVALSLGSIQEVDSPRPAGPPVDAIAVGHYPGVRPQAAELMIDEAISRALRGAGGAAPASGAKILTEFSDRGLLRLGLGQSFFLDDPRPGARRTGSAPPRIIALAGMGPPGNFGASELIVVSRELCWSLGRMGRDHLATVLIGSGNGNLPADVAVEAWLAGIAEAAAEAAKSGSHRLGRITFVEHDPRRIEAIDRAIRQGATKPEIRRKATIQYKGLQFLEGGGDAKPIPVIDGEAEARLDALIVERMEQDHRRDLDRFRARRGSGGPSGGGDLPATRLNVEMIPVDVPTVGPPTTGVPTPSRARYIYSAITETASIPQREILIDRELIEEANDRLPAESDPAKQHEIGDNLGRLLIPEDLAPRLNSTAPLVLALDSRTARIHWEMVTQPTASGDEADGGPPAVDRARRFLSTHRTLTRQFRTSLASLPQPSRGSRRDVRVLVVADPAGGDDALPGAREEGKAVVRLFEAYNDLSPKVRGANHFVVDRLIGPVEATRYEVMSRLLNGQYDILHYAGHCYFNRDDPSASGWIFEGRRVLSATELGRVKQVPRFIFSNACESGITPDRPQDRNDRLAPSFAEAFFAQGVANFVCTAWPVDDATALRFAWKLYSGLLGFDPKAPAALNPRPMHLAMQEARLAVIDPPNDSRTWGAYQHYGSPHFRLFDPSQDDGHGQDASEGDAAKTSPTGQSESTAKTEPGRAKKKKG